MKVLVASDIHGSLIYTKKLISVIEKEGIEKIILLGDLYYHGPRNALPTDYNPLEVSKLLNSKKDILTVIKGNCDSEVDEMISEFPFYADSLLEINGKNVFCTHGHKYDINVPPPIDFDIMLYGHYHVGFIKEVGQHIFANPGSVSLPKGESTNSYLIFDDNGLILMEL